MILSIFTPKKVKLSRMIVKLMLQMKLIQMKVKMLPKLLNKPLASKSKKAYQTMNVGDVKELPVE